MDKYVGVQVKITLNNNATVKGQIHGKDDDGNLVLKNVSTVYNGHSTHEDMTSIMTSLIQDLEVLEMSSEVKKPQAQQQQQVQPPQVQPPQIQQPIPQQHYNMQQEQLKQQQQLHLMQRQQQFYQQQQQQYHAMHHQPSPHATHVDPAILFQQGQQHQQMHSPYRDPAIISTQQHDKSNMNGHSLDPAILFTQGQITKHQGQQQQQQLKSLDPSILFQQASSPSPSQVPYQDPAIISVTNTPEIKTPSTPSTPPKNKKPLFGGKKTRKEAKEVVVFEDYSDFESGKTPKSNVSTPTTKKKVKEEEKPKSVTKQPKTKTADAATPKKATTKTPPVVEILTKSKPNHVPTSLIPPKARRTGSNSSSKNATPEPPAVRILTVSGGIQIPTVTSQQMAHAKNVARETGFTQAQLIENGAFGISMMVLKAIGGHRRIQPDNHNAAPVVVVLVGPTSIGEFGTAAARHLANRGCQVIVSISEETYCSASIEQYKALAKFSGARIVNSIQELPNQYTTPVDIIVDALLGSETKKMSAAIQSQMHWANTNKAPVLSLDFPSGVNADDGTTTPHHIAPKWTLCLGSPYTGCISRNVTGELFLADSGMPPLCFESVVPGFHIPWGNEFVLPLEYA